MEARAAAGGIGDRLILTGLRRDVPALLNGMDIFVITSKWEGLPRVLPQAMATGLPIVATEADGSAEAIRDGENGFLVPRGRSEIVAERLAALVDDPDLRRSMGRAGLEAVPPFGDIEMVPPTGSLLSRSIALSTSRRQGGRELVPKTFGTSLFYFGVRLTKGRIGLTPPIDLTC